MSLHDRLAQMHVQEKQGRQNNQPEKNKTEASSSKLNWTWGPPAERVKITGISIPFLDLVWLMVKLTFAAIPAGIIVVMIWYLLALALFAT